MLPFFFLFNISIFMDTRARGGTWWSIGLGWDIRDQASELPKVTMVHRGSQRPEEEKKN